MNWVKRQNKKPNKRLNKLSDDEEVNRVLPTTCSDTSPPLEDTPYCTVLREITQHAFSEEMENYHAHTIIGIG